MAPKKKELTKLSYNEFMQDTSFGGNWADEVEETYGTQPLPTTERRTVGNSGFSSGFGAGSDRFAGYARQEREFPQELPTKPPYTAHLGNLSYNATQETVTDFFADCGVVGVRIVEDRADGRPKGFGYAEFATLEGLKKALELDEQNFDGRTMRVRIADPPKDRHGNESTRDLSDWTRKGPLPAEPFRNDRRGPRDFNEPRAPRDGLSDESKFKEINWERRGPLSPLAPPSMERGGSRDGSRSQAIENNRADSFRHRRASPAAWIPGEGNQDNRPARREFVERPERALTAAEQDNQWRARMRPDMVPAKSPVPSRPGSEASSSPALAPAVPTASAGRPKLNLQKRTVSEAPGLVSPSLAGDSKASPFGAARPIDTAARERAIEEKHLQMLKKKEVEERAKEERRLTKEATVKEASEKEASEKEASEKDAVEAADTNGDVEKLDIPVAVESALEAPNRTEAEKAENAETNENGVNSPEQKVPIRPPQGPKSRAGESGNWRQSSGESHSRAPPSGPRERRAGGAPRASGRGFEERQNSHGGRGFEERQNSRGGRGFEERQNNRGGRGFEERQNSRRSGVSSTPNASANEEEGWTVVSATAKGRRGRPVVS